MEFNYLWWIQVIEIPLITGLFMFIKTHTRQTQKDLISFKDEAKNDIIKLAENLSSYKLEVAISYCSISYIRDLETRLTNHLLRIEEKLEKRKSDAK
ncbi:MAG: hypothetical protein LBR35_00065 [Rickettsiales bacterium]|jgi:hypothetical protein|nr:hypothetical protein [Rickettsiales bacterium]